MIDQIRNLVRNSIVVDDVTIIQFSRFFPFFPSLLDDHPFDFAQDDPEFYRTDLCGLAYQIPSKYFCIGLKSALPRLVSLIKF